MKRLVSIIILVLVVCTIVISAEKGENENPLKHDGFKVHDMDQPKPTIIRAGATDDAPPSDAIVLFDGKDMSKWNQQSEKAKKAKKTWRIVNGAMQPTKGAGTLQTNQPFGSMQLHIEWRTPERVVGTGQGRGNSGVFMMGHYELQVLDCWQKKAGDDYDNPTYADGQAGSVYGQKPPLVNACRSHHEWQSYDVIFHRPIFNKDGSVKKKATITVIQNGVLIQDHWEILGNTNHKRRAAYSKGHADKLPITLQDHGNPTEFRNIWVRELKD